MKYYIFFFALICSCAFTSCKSDEVPYVKNDDWKVYYFDFDEVAHYSRNTNTYEVFYDTLNPNQDILSNLLRDKAPSDLNDTTYVLKMEELGYKKNEIPTNKYADLRELFRERSYTPYDYAMCIPVYRDILIFKKESEICGIAKICFECSHISTSGTNAYTRSFGSQQGFKKLHELLYKKE